MGLWKIIRLFKSNGVKMSADTGIIGKRSVLRKTQVELNKKLKDAVYEIKRIEKEELEKREGRLSKKKPGVTQRWFRKKSE